jgi:hypothetical protein
LTLALILDFSEDERPSVKTNGERQNWPRGNVTDEVFLVGVP